MGLDSRRLNRRQQVAPGTARRRQQVAPGTARIRGAALLHGDSSRGSMCFPGEVWGGAFFKKAASPTFPAFLQAFTLPASRPETNASWAKKKSR